MCRVKEKDRFIFTCSCPVFSTFVKGAVFSPVYGFGIFVETQVAVGVWTYIWVIDSSPLISMSALVPLLAVFTTVALWYSLKQLGDTAGSVFIS